VAATLTGLQQVTVEQVLGMPVPELQQLPSSITELSVYGARAHPIEVMTPSLPPQLSQLTGLLHLQLSGCAVPPTVLGSVATQLQALEIIDCSLLQFDPDADLKTEGTAALLDVLPRFMRLRKLRLFVRGIDTVNIALERFSALPASSHLAHLALAHHNEQPLPQGAVQHMFPANRQLMSLQHFGISTLYGTPEEWCVDSADVVSIASACPQLQQLELGCSFRPDADVTVLLQLPGSLT
jgi:hypothetical protein